MKSFLSSVLCFLSLVLCSPAFADAVYSQSGSELKGLVVEEHRDRVILSTETGEQTVLRAEVDQIFYDDPERNYLFLGNQSVEEGNFAVAQGFFRKALQIHPFLQEAEDALGRLADLQAKRGWAYVALDPPAALKKDWGLILEPGQPWPVIREVRESSFAARSSVLPGDAVVSVWGESMGFLPPAEAAQALLGPPGSSVKLTLQRSISLPGSSSVNWWDWWKGSSAWPGVTLGMEHLGLTVLNAQPGGPADSSGIRAKDRIVEIDGHSTRYLPLSDADRILRQAKEKGVSLIIHRDVTLVRQ